MPYDIREFPDGFKVCKKGTEKCFSKDPIPLKRAEAQRKAIAISEHKVGGIATEAKRGKYTPEELLNEAVPIERLRKKAPNKVVSKVMDELKKIDKIPYKKKDHPELFWGQNPYNGKLPAITIDLPIIDVPKLQERDVRKKAYIMTKKQAEKRGYRKINHSCIITHNNEIIMVYVRGEDDPAIYKALEVLKELGEQMLKYYPEKDHSFYSGMFNKMDKHDRYYGWNALDGFIRYLNSTYGNNIFCFHPRNAEAQFDLDFLYNLMYSYSGMYALEKRWCPAIAQYRLDKAKNVDKISIIPPLPLETLPATTIGVSKNFASALHDDSGVMGITETIAWTKADKGKESYFINDEAKMYFDIATDNCLILIPPKIAHGTMNTGEHGGMGMVNITKQNQIADTDFTREWYDTWRKWINSSEPDKIFEKYRKDNVDTLPNKNLGAGKGLSGCGFFDDEDWEKLMDEIQDIPDNKEHYALDLEGGDATSFLKGVIDTASKSPVVNVLSNSLLDWGINKLMGGEDPRDWGMDEEGDPPQDIMPYLQTLQKYSLGAYPAPDLVSGGAIPINKKLYEKAKEIVYPQYKKPSAFRSGAVIKKYKELGGKFKEEGERKLKRWFEEEWKDIGNKDYPVFRPSKRITKDTPLTPEEIDPENLQLQIKEKQKIKGKKNLKPFKELEGGRCPKTGEYPCKCKGGALYAKDKYATGEKELTPTEKKIVKREMGEGNPEIAEIAREPMGDDDIHKYFPNAKILKYSELKNYTDITQLLPRPKTFFFLLYERTLNVGHWTLVSRYKDNGIDTIEFFCSYGSKIDAPLTWTPVGMRVQLGQDKPYLSNLLDKSPFRVIYNPVQFQSKKSPISTCGAYDTLRASELEKHNTTLDEFIEMLEEVKKGTGLNYDEIVSNLVHLR